MTTYSENNQTKLEKSNIRLKKLIHADRIFDFATIITFFFLIIAVVLKIVEIISISLYGIILLCGFAVIIGFLSLIIDKLKRDELEKNEDLSDDLFSSSLETVKV